MTSDAVILIVEDNEANQLLASAVLEREGYKVEVASSSDEALDRLKRRPPDLILMDVQLPGIDGLEATRRLLGRDCPPVVLLLSTYDEDAGEHFVAESGASAYVTKSAFGPDQLEEAWSAAVR